MEEVGCGYSSEYGRLSMRGEAADDTGIEPRFTLFGSFVRGMARETDTSTSNDMEQ